METKTKEKQKQKTKVQNWFPKIKSKVSTISYIAFALITVLYEKFHPLFPLKLSDYFLLVNGSDC